MSRQWALPLGALGYAALFSLAVWQALAGGTVGRVRLALLAGWGLLLVAALGFVVLWLSSGGRPRRALEVSWNRLRTGNVWLRAAFFVFLILLPAGLAFSGLDRGLLQIQVMRVVVFGPFLLLAAQVFPRPVGHYGLRLALTLLASAYVYMVAHELSLVTSYPFALGWSEGNRLYDYSLVFGQDLYNASGDLALPYGSPGRHGLWGLAFLIPGLPIAGHRLWNAILWFLPPLIFGLFLARPVARLDFKAGLALWAALFLNQGPIYTPLLLAATVVLAFDRWRPPARLLALAAASFYAGLSRWTWSLAPGAWGALLVLGEQEREPGEGQPASSSLVRRLMWVVVYGLAGSLPGILANWQRFAAPSQTTSLSQPLLWERLLPNAVYSPGILLGTAVAAGPLILLLFWMLTGGFARRQVGRWRADAWLLLGAGVLFFVTLAAGLVASAKIGGGTNLHNLDMFFLTLLFILAVALRYVPLEPLAWPRLAQVLLALVVLVPAWQVMRWGAPLDLPAPAVAQASLEKLRARIEQYAPRGEILFLDQRQLLTFGDISGVPLVPEYEKKYVMDQAMAENRPYFEAFYRDLADQRFALIVSEPLFARYQPEGTAFAEENNAWVKWVSEPILCYYEPKATLREVRVQLLVPRVEVEDCPR